MTSEVRPIDIVELDFINLTGFERNFDMMYWRQTMRERWTLSIYCATLYLVLVFGGAYLMRTRKPFKLNGLLAVWNVMLSVMSITALVRSLPEFTNRLSSENGLYHSVCEWYVRNDKQIALFCNVIISIRCCSATSYAYHFPAKV